MYTPRQTVNRYFMKKLLIGRSLFPVTLVWAGPSAKPSGSGAPVRQIFQAVTLYEEALFVVGTSIDEYAG